jgi:hypothetical protein
MPPVPPLFVGTTLSAREEPQRWSAPLLALRPRDGHAFTSPRDTLALFLPPERLVSVTWRPLGDARWAELVCHGDFSRVSRPSTEVLAPIAADDAARLCAVLGSRYRLPLEPLDVLPSALATLPANAYVRVVGTYREGHCEGPNFEGIVLEPRQPAPGRYRAVGFASPGTPAGEMPVVGYNGPRLTAIAVEPAI